MRAEKIGQLLPDVVRRTATPGSVLESLLGAMEALHGPTEELLTDFAQFIDPHRCPPEFVPYLAEWVGVGWMLGGLDAGFPTGDGPLRDVIASAQRLATQRGTAAGLCEMLEAATGTTGFEVIAAPHTAFHVLVTCPGSIQMYQDLVWLIIRHEKPAFVTVDIVIGHDPPERLGRPTEEETTGEPHA